MTHKVTSIVVIMGCLLGSGVAVTVETGCRPQVEQECVPLDPSLDYDGPVQRRPYCHWAPGELPQPPDGYAKTFRVFATFEPTEDEPCDPCDVERFEALLHAKVAQTCSRLDYTGLSVACYIPPEESTSGSCTVAGIYFSNFDNVTYDAACLRCIPGEALCDGPPEM